MRAAACWPAPPRPGDRRRGGGGRDRRLLLAADAGDRRYVQVSRGLPVLDRLRWVAGGPPSVPDRRPAQGVLERAGTTAAAQRGGAVGGRRRRGASYVAARVVPQSGTRGAGASASVPQGGLLQETLRRRRPAGQDSSRRRCRWLASGADSCREMPSMARSGRGGGARGARAVTARGRARGAGDDRQAGTDAERPALYLPARRTRPRLDVDLRPRSTSICVGSPPAGAAPATGRRACLPACLGRLTTSARRDEQALRADADGAVEVGQRRRREPRSAPRDRRRAQRRTPTRRRPRGAGAPSARG